MMQLHDSGPATLAELEARLRRDLELLVMPPAKDWLADQDISGVCTHHGIKIGLSALLSPGAGESHKEQAAEALNEPDALDKGAKLPPPDPQNDSIESLLDRLERDTALRKAKRPS